MPNPPLSDELKQEALALIKKTGGNIKAAADLIGVPRNTMLGRLRSAGWSREETVPPLENVTFPPLKSGDLPIEDLVDHLSARFEQRQAAHQGRRWMPISFKTNDPVMIVWVGDPHLDDNGCNWPLLQSHIEILKRPGVYAVNVGDTVNNWGPRLVHKWADQNTTAKDARRLAIWFLKEAGIPWLVWCEGNHDAHYAFYDWLKVIGAQTCLMEDWNARFRLVFPSKLQIPVWVAHNFKGTSQWNMLHGHHKVHKMMGGAEIYVCGHHHDWGLFTGEERGEMVHFIRARGYKFIDDYADRLQFPEQNGGASIGTVIDPLTGARASFDNLEEGADYLAFKRGRK